MMRIKKLIYGMMQAGRNWWDTLDASYVKMGYKRSQADQCVRSIEDRGDNDRDIYR